MNDYRIETEYIIRRNKEFLASVMEHFFPDPILNPDGTYIGCQRNFQLMKANSEYGYCTHIRRIITTLIYRMTSDFLESGESSVNVLFPKQGFYETIVPEKFRAMTHPKVVAQYVNECVLYNTHTTIRKRSGGKDPETGRNKQTSLGSYYRFNSVHDIHRGVILQLAFWFTWHSQVNGNSGKILLSDFLHFLEELRHPNIDIVMWYIRSPREQGGYDFDFMRVKHEIPTN